MNTETQLATVPERLPIEGDERGLKLHSLGSMWRFAQMAASSGIYKNLTPEQAVITIQAGAELGLSPVWSLTNIMVVNGRPSVWGDALLGLVLAHKECEDVIETNEGEGENHVATCEVRRKGRVPVIRKFSAADAKRAGLTGKGVHASYPKRMLAMRARAFACRDAFADALRGLSMAEEQLSVTEPKQVKAREVATNLVLPDEPDQPTEVIQPSDNDGTDPGDFSKGEELFK